MKTKLYNKSVILLLTLLLFCFCGMFVALLSVETDTASAATKFTVRGASIRYNLTDKDDGIRFHVIMDKAQYDALGSKETGLLIIPEYKLGNSTLDINTSGAYNTLSNGTLTWSGIYEPNTDAGENTTDMEAVVVVKGYGMQTQYYNARFVVRGFIKNGSSYTYTDNTVSKSLADVALEQNISKYLLNYQIDFYNASGTLIKRQSLKYGQQFTFPNVSVGSDNTFLGWYRRVGGTSTAVWSDTYTAQAEIDRTVTKNMQFKACVVGNVYETVQYSSTIYNKEHVYVGDPSVTYRDGFYYVVNNDSSQNIYVEKSRSLEDLLNVGARGKFVQTTAGRIYTPTSSSELGAETWAPELTYIRGKWYIYVCGVAPGLTHTSTNMKMFVLECSSQDPTDKNAWSAPIRLWPSGFDDRYAIDGHAFEYKGTLYYVFSGQKSSDTRPQLYMCSMSSPTAVNNDVVKINLDTKNYGLTETTSRLKEGPCTVVDGDDLYLIFSVGGWDASYYFDAKNDYHLDYYKLTGSNVLSKSSWTDKGTCLQQDAEKRIFSVGHNHIFKNADGSWWTSYHAILVDEVAKWGTNSEGNYVPDHTSALAQRRVFVQPFNVSNGALDFGGVKDTVAITDEQGGLKKNLNVPGDYIIDCGNGAEGDKSYGILWKNEGEDFTVSTMITRVEGDANYCAGVTLYERTEGKTSRLLIGVEMEGNIFLCNYYSRRSFCYKYDGWQWNNESVAKMTVTYTASEKTLKVTIANNSGSKSKIFTYTLAQLNALVSDNVGSENKPFNLSFTGKFGIGLGGNLNKCKFTDVIFKCDKGISMSWDDNWGDGWNPYD